MIAAQALALQRDAGNAAVAGIMLPRRHSPDYQPTVSRCGPDHPNCGCNDEETLRAAETTVQRADPFDAWLSPPKAAGFPDAVDTFGSPTARADRLHFSDRSFADKSLPEVCPNCHQRKPTISLFPKYVDREATEARLVSWAMESERMLHHSWAVRQLQLDRHSALDRIVDDYGAGLTLRISATHEFTGSDAAREVGADTMRRRWPEIRSAVRRSTQSYYQNELMTAVELTPKNASPLINSRRLSALLADGPGGTVQLGRWGATAVPGQRVSNMVIYRGSTYTVHFTLVDRPTWFYVIGTHAFLRNDPFVTEVTRQVYDKTKSIQHLMPLLLKVGAFGVGFSGSIAWVITGIVLDELATEMQADVDGRPGRTPEQILGSVGTQFLVDRLFHGLLGGVGGKAAGGATEAALKAERIADRAAPVVRRELAEAEKPLVKDALEAGTARQITDDALQAKGYSVEVAIETAGERHLYRLRKDGRWCRSSATICDLDLGADVIAATKSPRSFTQAKLEDVRSLLSRTKDEMTFLTSVYERMRRAGRMDVSLLNAEERIMLSELAPSGDAAALTLRELRELPRTLGLKKEIAAAFDQEAKLVQQLYREGRPLYEVMRAASPSYAARARLIVERGRQDAASGIYLPSDQIHVDHIVPLNEIVRMPRFDKLRPEQQLDIVNDLKNLQVINAAANSSRGERSWWTWRQARIYYDDAAIAKMRALENEIRSYLVSRIAALSRP